jgi:hypothetical protein
MRSEEGWDWVCFLALRGPVGRCTSSLDNTALSANAGSCAFGGGLLGERSAALLLPCLARLPLCRL